MVVVVVVAAVVAIFSPKKHLNPSTDYWKPKFYSNFKVQKNTLNIASIGLKIEKIVFYFESQIA